MTARISPAATLLRRRHSLGTFTRRGGRVASSPLGAICLCGLTRPLGAHIGRKERIPPSPAAKAAAAQLLRITSPCWHRIVPAGHHAEHRHLHSLNRFHRRRPARPTSGPHRTGQPPTATGRGFHTLVIGSARSRRDAMARSRCSVSLLDPALELALRCLSFS